MQVFGQRMAARGGRPLPLAQYLQQDIPAATVTSEELQSFDPFTTRLSGLTFHEALRRDDGFPSVVAFLLGGVDVNIRDKHGAMPLHVAVSRVKCGRDDENDDYPLVPDCPNQMIITFLIDNGADINGRNAAGETPLMVAATTSNVHALRLLLQYGADPLRRDDLGHTVLHHAALFPCLLETLHVWIEDLPLLAARECLLHTLCRQGCEAKFTILFLIEQLELDVNAREGASSITNTIAITNTVSDATAVSEVVSPPGVNDTRNGFVAKSRKLSTSAVTMINDGYTPLHYAVLAGDPVLVRTLLLKGAEADKPDGAGVTPFQLAYECAQSARSLWIQPRRFSNFFSFLRSRRSTVKSGNPAKVYAILKAYHEEASPTIRQAVLQRNAADETLLWNLITFKDFIFFAAAAILPHVFMALCATITVRFWILALVLIMPLSWCIGANQKDAKLSNARPLRSAGFFWGYALVITFCCMHQVPGGQTQIASVVALILNSWIPACGIGSIVCALAVMFKSPGTVESTAAQRLGIYKTIYHSKGVPPDDLQQGIDVRCMVKKPLRAQRCRHVGCVVLRFDHYCTWLSTTIGGGNHRVYLWFLIFYTTFLGGWFFRFFLLSSPFGDTGRSGSGSTTAVDASDVELALQRFVDIYVALVLPPFFAFFLFTLFQQLVYIGRGVTSYDVLHPSKCTWCFTLGSRTYSLFDAGFWENMRGFFLMQENLLVLNYRMPAMSARLQRFVKEYQTLQFSPCQHGEHCHSHTHKGHGHSHGDHLVLDEGTQEHVKFAFPFNTENAHVADSTVYTSSTAVVTSSEVEAAAGRLFQLMVQQNSANVNPDKELQGDFSVVDWEQVVAKAQSMFSFFKSTLNR